MQRLFSPINEVPSTGGGGTRLSISCGRGCAAGGRKPDPVAMRSVHTKYTPSQLIYPAKIDDRKNHTLSSGTSQSPSIWKCPPGFPRPSLLSPWGHTCTPSLCNSPPVGVGDVAALNAAGAHKTPAEMYAAPV